jgi:uncharacterized protein YecA (UPF0149 family)
MDINKFDVVVWVRKTDSFPTLRDELLLATPTYARGCWSGLASSKIGRNDPCPCDSGKKFLKSCGKPT